MGKHPEKVSKLKKLKKGVEIWGDLPKKNN
nr:MAG TPA: hypothetical protein [Caudoviricetes sp.]